MNKLNIKTIAEGVETLEQLNYLIDVNCDYIQGYYLGKPGPEELIGDIIESLFDIDLTIEGCLAFKACLE